MHGKGCRSGIQGTLASLEPAQQYHGQADSIMEAPLIKACETIFEDDGGRRTPKEHGKQRPCMAQSRQLPLDGLEGCGATTYNDIHDEAIDFVQISNILSLSCIRGNAAHLFVK